MRYALAAFLTNLAVAYAADAELPTGKLASGAGTGVTALANRIVDTLTYLAFPLAFAGIIYSAFLLINSQGNPDAWAKAKKNIVSILIGFILITFASIFVYLFRSFFALP